MNCSKCNSQVPDGAKFCPNCGALTAPITQNKSFCENCGLELPKGAKFCTVCGAAVTKMASAEVKPSDVLAPVTPSEPVSLEPAVDLMKTADESQNTVSVVTVNTESAYSIPIPTSDISMPSVGAAPVEEPAPAAVPEPVFAPGSLEDNGLGFIPEAPVLPETPAEPEPTGYSAAAASYAAPTAEAPAPTAAPVFAPPADNREDNPFVDLGMNAAAVAAKPIKKKSVLKPILIALCSLIGAVLIAAGVLFFVNKSLLFNIVLGNSGYAAMVEGNSIKEVTDKIDVSAMSNSIKSVSGSLSGVLTQMSNYSSGITTTSVKPMMSSSGMMNIGSVDFKTLINSFGDIMRDTYGANSANISMNFNAELTDTGMAQLVSAMHCSEKEVREVLDLINGSGFSVDLTADGKALESTVEMTGGSLKLNAKTVITEDGNVYLVLPFVSEKAIMVKIGSGYTASAGQVSDVYLELDEKELKRIIEKLVSVYVDVYKSSEITVKDGEISIAGATAKGKYITANLTGSKISEMIRRMGETIASDSYLCGKLAEFFSDCGMPITEDQLKNTLQSLFGMIQIPDDRMGLVIETVTDNSCRVLAKSYTVSADGKSMKISAVGDFGISTKNGNTAAIAVEIDGQTIASALFEKSSDTDGVCTVSIYSNGTSVSVKVKYSGVKETTFNGKPVVEGTYEIGMVLPADFTQAGGSDEAAAVVSSAKVLFSVNVENNNTIKETVSFEIPQYGKLSANAVLTTADKPNGISIPSDVLDISAAYGVTDPDEIPESLKKDVISYLKDMRNAVKKQNAGELGNKLAESLTELIDLAENGPTADIDDISNLMISISNEKGEIMQYDEMYQNEDETLSEKSDALISKYDDLLIDIASKNYTVTEKEFDAFKNRLATLTAEKDALRKEYDGANQQPGVDFTSKAENIDFSTLDFQSLSEILTEYVIRYNSVLGYNSDLFNRDAEINALVGETDKKYETALEDYDNLYDVYKAGSLNLSLMRKSRKSVQAFALSVEALEKAVAQVV